jgi:hypothetical protein
MSLFITAADAKAIDKAFREYKEAEQALHKAFLHLRPIEEIDTEHSDIPRKGRYLGFPAR